MNQQNTVEIVVKPTTSSRMPVTVAEMLNMPVDPDFTVNEAVRRI